MTVLEVSGPPKGNGGYTVRVARRYGQLVMLPQISSPCTGKLNLVDGKLEYKEIETGVDQGKT